MGSRGSCDAASAASSSAGGATGYIANARAQHKSKSSSASTDGKPQFQFFFGTNHDLDVVVPSPRKKGITHRGSSGPAGMEKSDEDDNGGSSSIEIDHGDRGCSTTGGADVEEPTVAAADDHPKPPQPKAKPEPLLLPLSASEKAKTRKVLLNTLVERKLQPTDARVQSLRDEIHSRRGAIGVLSWGYPFISGHKSGFLNAAMLDPPAAVRRGWVEKLGERAEEVKKTVPV
ncbi:unnamed protein product [Amoebophrya sp. A120]|nr:unnamed protein product [Amoebophrya sp. A120]|eukprot:GSA120T00014326001.1